MKRLPRLILLTVAVGLCRPALAINLGGVDVPKDRFIVFVAIGHSNMAGRVDDIDLETYETHPRAWNFKFDDGTDAWLPAQPPVHRDVSWQRGGGPATPFLKQLAADYPEYTFGIIQNAHSSVTVVQDYRRGLALYDEVVAVAQSVAADVTFGGVIAMIGFMESGNAGQAADFGNQVTQMMGEMRTDLSEPTLPLMIHQLSRGRAQWTTVRDQITALVGGGLANCASVPSDGPYKPGDDVHFTWVGQKAWGQAAAGLVQSQGWLPSVADAFAPRIARAAVIDATTVETVFDENLDATTAQATSTYALQPSLAISSATLGADQKTVTLDVAPLTSGSLYTLTVDGIEDTSGNAATGLVTSFDYELVNVPTSGLDLWLRADRGVVVDTVSSVPLWADQSGNGNDVIRARFANHPYLMPTAVAGSPALRFGDPSDPEGDFLERQLPSAYVGDSTLFMVFQLSSLGQAVNASIFASDPNGGSNASFQLQVDGGAPGNLEFYSDAAYVIGPASTAPMLLTVHIQGTGLELFVDGQSVGSHTIAAAEAKRYEFYALGHNRATPYVFLAADVAEVMLYQGALSPTDRTQVEQYLGSKYGLIASPAGVTVTPNGGLTTTEAGGSDSFSVVLDAVPSADVTIPVSSSDSTEGTVSTASLLFTSSDWSTPQTVSVFGVDDAAVDGNVGWSVLLGAAVSSDGAYDGTDPTDVTVTNLDDDGGTNLPPQAVIAGPSAANVGISVTFYGGGSSDDGSITGYAWDFGDGGSDTGDLVNYAWAAAGSYTVTLTVTDNLGLTAQDTLAVTVGGVLQPSVTLLRPTGGETFTSGTVESILWTTVDLDDVRIDFSSDGGTTWELVDYSDIDDPTWGAFDWSVPDVASGECMIMVQGYNFEAPMQSGLFTIVPTAVAPPGGGDVDGGCACTAGGVPLWFVGAVLLRRRRRRV